MYVKSEWGCSAMRELDVMEINDLQAKYGHLVDTATAEEDDDDDGEGAKVLVPN
jgi:hypothetical protein